jgi:hypothetical protein
MEYLEVENHDDYYTLDDETGFLNVQDQRGHFIVYDIALKDLKYRIQEAFILNKIK